MKWLWFMKMILALHLSKISHNFNTKGKYSSTFSHYLKFKTLMLMKKKYYKLN